MFNWLTQEVPLWAYLLFATCQIGLNFTIQRKIRQLEVHRH